MADLVVLDGVLRVAARAQAPGGQPGAGSRVTGRMEQVQQARAGVLPRLLPTIVD